MLKWKTNFIYYLVLFRVFLILLKVLYLHKHNHNKPPFSPRRLILFYQHSSLCLWSVSHILRAWEPDESAGSCFICFGRCIWLPWPGLSQTKSKCISFWGPSFIAWLYRGDTPLYSHCMKLEVRHICKQPRWLPLIWKGLLNPLLDGIWEKIHTTSHWSNLARWLLLSLEIDKRLRGYRLTRICKMVWPRLIFYAVNCCKIVHPFGRPWRGFPKRIPKMWSTWRRSMLWWCM